MTLYARIYKLFMNFQIPLIKFLIRHCRQKFNFLYKERRIFIEFIQHNIRNYIDLSELSFLAILVQSQNLLLLNLKIKSLNEVVLDEVFF